MQKEVPESQAMTKPFCDGDNGTPKFSRLPTVNLTYLATASGSVMAYVSLGDCPSLENVFCNATPPNTTMNDSQIEKVLVCYLGPRRSPFFLPVSLTYLVIFITGVAGNVLTCAVIANHHKMRTPTNLYLLSLAVSDLLVLIFGMPMEVYDLWKNYPFPFGEGGCYFKIFLFETVCFASVLNVTALSVERYIAVVHPLKTRYAMTNKHARKVITGVWALSLVCAVPNTSLHGIYYLHLPERVAESATCGLLKPLWIYNIVIQVTTVFFYFIPMSIISALYMVIGIHLGREKRLPQGKIGKNCSSDTSWKIHLECDRRRQVTKMLSVVVAVFAICWAPFHTDRLLWSFITQWTDTMHAVFEYVHIFSGVLFYLSSAVNPIIYNLLSTRFRERFRELVCSQADNTSSRTSSPPMSKVHKSSSKLTSQSQARIGDAKCQSPFVISNGSWEQGDEITYL